MADKFFDAMFAVSVIGGSSGPAPVIVPKNITANGTYSALDDQADGYNPVVVDVPNSYTASDEGKVVSGGALVTQTSTTANANGTINTTTNDEVVVNVPNTYTAGDEGKVVSSGQLVAQTNYGTVTENGTYDTTLHNSVTVNAPSGAIVATLTPNDPNSVENFEGYYTYYNNKLYIWGVTSGRTQAIKIFNFDTPLSDIGVPSGKSVTATISYYVRSVPDVYYNTVSTQNSGIYINIRNTSDGRYGFSGIFDFS